MKQSWIDQGLTEVVGAIRVAYPQITDAEIDAALALLRVANEDHGGA